MNFCSHCGSPVISKVPAGDHLPRHVCEHCGTIHYRNPKLIVGCVPEDGGRILLCRRAIEPRRGYWTVPAGFMETGETLQQAAERESHEEALARVQIGSLLAIVHVHSAQQVHVFFRARLAEPEFGVGPESLETRMVTEDEIPWADLAFPSITFALRRFVEDRVRGREDHHFTTFEARTG